MMVPWLCFTTWLALSAAGVTPLPKVAPEEEREALRLFAQANAAAAVSSYEEAIEAYRQALKHWDHPAIHYNLALALVGHAGPLEQHQELEAAIRHGPGPLKDPEKFEKAKKMMAELEAELSRLDLSCQEPGAQVTVDGRPGPLQCPGSSETWMQPGAHEVLITKAGFRPAEKKLTLAKGTKTPIQLKLFTDAQWTQLRTPWPYWAPWGAMSAGAAVALVGGVLHARAGQELHDYDSAVAQCAGAATGPVFASCPAAASAALAPLLSAGETEQAVAYGFYVTGAAILAGGAVLHYFNVPRAVLVDPETGVQISVAPWLGPNSRGAVLTVGF